MANNIRPASMERITTPALAKAFIDEQVAGVVILSIDSGRMLLAIESPPFISKF